MLLENHWYAIAGTTDPDVRVYYTRLLLMSDYGVQGLLKGSQFGQIPLMFEPAPIIELVLEMPGVVHAEVRAHHILLTKSPVFTWDEIDERMLVLMEGIALATDLNEKEHGVPKEELQPYVETSGCGSSSIGDYPDYRKYSTATRPARRPWGRRKSA